MPHTSAATAPVLRRAAAALIATHAVLFAGDAAASRARPSPPRAVAAPATVATARVPIAALPQPLSALAAQREEQAIFFDNASPQAAVDDGGVAVPATAQEPRATPALSPAAITVSAQSVKRLLRRDRDGELELFGSLYPALLESGEEVASSWLKTMEERLSASNGDVRRDAAVALGNVYPALIRQGKIVSSERLEEAIKYPDNAVRAAAAKALADVYAERALRDDAAALARLEDLSRSSDDSLSAPAAVGLGGVYAATIRRDKTVPSERLRAFEALGLYNMPLRRARIAAQGDIDAAFIERGRDVPAERLAALGKNPDAFLRSAEVAALESILRVMIRQGRSVDWTRLETLAVDRGDAVRRAARAARGRLYAALIEHGQDVPAQALETLRREALVAGNETGVAALGAVYAAMARRGASVPLDSLEALSKAADEDVRRAAITAWGSVLAAKVLREGRVSLARFERMVAAVENGALHAAGSSPGINAAARSTRSVALAALAGVYAAAARRGNFFLLPAHQKKHELWRARGVPYHAALVERYLAAPDAAAFFFDLNVRAQRLISEGFDPKDAQQRVLVFMGLREKGFDLDWSEFKQRLSVLVKFDKKHPGSFRRLFAKTHGLPILTVGGPALDREHGDVDAAVLERNRLALLEVERRVSSLAWLDGFPGHKTFSARNLYYQLKKQQARDAGRLQADGRFHVAFPDEAAMRRELAEDLKAQRRFVFGLARERLADRALADKLLPLMRDLVLSEALSDGALKRALGADDLETRISAYRNLYGDYTKHLPGALGLRLDDVKGLPRTLEAFAREVTAELAKSRQVAGKEDAAAYRLAPMGFTSVFRGRYGIIDCSFHLDKGAPYTRAMHKDTLYYGVRKGDKPKGYVGLFLGELKDGRKVLTIDTINSASLDGNQLLRRLFAELTALAKSLGAVGIALPEDLAPSFNFGNEETIENMALYKKAKTVKVRPLHARSWAAFTEEYGEDDYNSIEDGRFKLLAM